MGGSFSPFHLAHLNSLLTVREQFALKNIIVIPSFQTPLREGKELVSPFHRKEMLKKALNLYPFMLVDDQEIGRKGLSLSHQSVTQLVKQRKGEELFFIMGLDQFYIFDQWRNFKDILKKTNLIVTSRPGRAFPQKLADFPKGLQPLIKKRLTTKLFLKGTDKKIYFCALKDMDISSSHIKQRLREGKETAHLLPPAVSLYIKKNRLYREEELDLTQELIDFSIKELKKKKAYDIKSFDLRSKLLPFSYGLIATASNTRQTKALAIHLKKKIKEQFELNPLSEEGQKESRWIVFDYGNLVIHIFYGYTKKIYNLEELWERPFARTN